MELVRTVFLSLDICFVIQQKQTHSRNLKPPET